MTWQLAIFAVFNLVCFLALAGRAVFCLWNRSLEIALLSAAVAVSLMANYPDIRDRLLASGWLG